MKKQLTIALLGKYFGWGGGTELLRIIGNALALTAKSNSLSVYLLLPVENKIESCGDLLKLWKLILTDLARFKVGNHRERQLYDSNMLDFFTNIDGQLQIIKYNDTPSGLTDCIKKIKADVALPVLGTLGKPFVIPWIGYLYDFQHKYYPNFFSADECHQRDMLFANILRDAKAVIVNSKAVENDIRIFFPDSESRIFCLPFAPTPILSWFDEPEKNILRKYCLPDKYFIISNQFWMHKSHITAFEALSMLCHEDIHIVCTGKTEDWRAPGYFDELCGRISKLGVLKKIHFIGHVPKNDQIQIMKKSIAVIQPTMFEGGPGGGSVYDAVSLGIPAIISDIIVNREILDDVVVFFAQGSAKDLAVKMSAALLCNKKQLSREVLIEKGAVRARMLGDRLLEAIEHVL